MDTSTLLHDAIALVALTAMEIVLGIDNIVFISVVSARLPEAERKSARQIGLLAAMGTRIVLLLTLTWIMQLTHPIVSLSELGLPADWATWLREEHRHELNDVVETQAKANQLRLRAEIIDATERNGQ